MCVCACLHEYVLTQSRSAAHHPFCRQFTAFPSSDAFFSLTASLIANADWWVQVFPNCPLGWTVRTCPCTCSALSCFHFSVKVLCFVVPSIFKLQPDVASLSGVTHSFNTQLRTRGTRTLLTTVSHTASVCLTSSGVPAVASRDWACWFLL